MKKKVLLISLLSILLLVGCDLKKDSITSADFNKVLRDNEYSVTNSSKSFANYQDIKEVFIGQNLDKSFQIEFYSFDSKERADTFYDSNVKAFEKVIDGTSSKIELDGLNYKTFKKTTSNAYQVISCVNYTCLYANTKREYKDDVNTILKIFDY